MRRNSRLTAVVAAVAALAMLASGACSGDDALESATPSSIAGGDAGIGVGMLETELVDTSRDTPASRGQPERGERVLDTVVWYPAIGDPDGDVEQDAEPATDHGPFPLIVFSHGYGGSPANVEDLADDWVRAGFVVAAPYFPLSRSDHRGGPDPDDVENQPGDVSFVISALTDELDDDSPLAGLIDADHIGAAGHSLGAITTLGVTANTCCADERIDAVVVMSATAVPFPGGEYDFSSAPPMLVVHGTDDELLDYEDGVALFDDLVAPKGLLTIDGGTHDSFLEDGGKGHADVAASTTDFFLASLAGDTDALERLTDETTEAGVATMQFETASTREASAEPTTGLTAGQAVTVRWSGFIPGGTVNVLQCSQGGVADGSDCARTAGHLMQADPAGTGLLQLAVVVGPVGTGRCGAGADGCVILVNDSGLSDPDATIRIPISFAP